MQKLLKQYQQTVRRLVFVTQHVLTVMAHATRVIVCSACPAKIHYPTPCLPQWRRLSEGMDSFTVRKGTC